ncbi:hypothetical protein Droror1_Dr00003189 [Drosera rotundifolia]
MKSPKHHLSNMIKKSKDVSSSCYIRLPCSDEDGTCSHGRRGYVPVMVGNDEVTEKFMVRTEHITHPSILAFLELSADEFGYEQQGVLRIPCEPDCFREIINNLYKGRTR